MRAFLFALDPTPAQEQAFRSHCGAQRFAFNFGVELARKIREQRAAEYSYGLRGAELTPCSAYDLREHDTIVIEDLHVAGMIRNKRLARHIAQLGMGEIRRQLTYKSAEAGARLVVADRWYPSSRTCSACGVVRAKLTLAEREFHCQSCGTRLGRDYNAALNLAALAAQVTSTESSRRDAKPPAGNPRKTTTGGTGYRHGKTPGPAGSQRHPREAVAR